MRRQQHLTLLLWLVFAFIGALQLQNCSEDADQIVDHEYDSSCLSCHTDQDALLALAEPEESGGESSGEG